MDQRPALLGSDYFSIDAIFPGGGELELDYQINVR
jgi:hypothetical protein